MRTATNRLLCETAIAPDGGVVTIEDAAAKGTPGTYAHTDTAPNSDAAHRVLWVPTMSIHECDIVGRHVWVRVLSGEDTGGLGVLAFDGHLNITSGIMAIGERRNPDRQLLAGPRGLSRVSVFVANDIDAIRFDDSAASDPISGPSEITLLLHGDTWRTYTQRNAPAWWGRR